MNENFFRTTFTSRCLDYLADYYSFETEYNSSEGRCDFLAIPKPGVAKPAAANPYADWNLRARGFVHT